MSSPNARTSSPARSTKRPRSSIWRVIGAEYIVSEQGILNEAQQRGEDIMRHAEQERRRSMGQIDEYALQQLSQVRRSRQDGLNLVMEALQNASASLGQAKRHVGRK